MRTETAIEGLRGIWLGHQDRPRHRAQGAREHGHESQRAPAVSYTTRSHEGMQAWLVEATGEGGQAHQPAMRVCLCVMHVRSDWRGLATSDGCERHGVRKRQRRCGCAPQQAHRSRIPWRGSAVPAAVRGYGNPPRSARQIGSRPVQLQEPCR